MGAPNLLDLGQQELFQNVVKLDQHVKVIPETDCWIWKGTLRDGKPFFKEKGVKAVEAAFNIYKGLSIPRYTRINCQCGNPNCINPDHILLLSPKKKRSNIPEGPQTKKRKVQTKQNQRLLEYINKSQSLTGGVIMLSGTKVEEAASPYLRTNIADKVLICENNLKNYEKIALTLNKLKSSNISLYYNTADILDVVKEINHLKGRWTGFDFDFNGYMNPDIIQKFKTFIDEISIKESTWWMRITVSTRKHGYNGNNKDFDELLAYMISSNFIMIEDLARGPAYNYCDSMAMQTMQVICKRREYV